MIYIVSEYGIRMGLIRQRIMTAILEECEEMVKIYMDSRLEKTG